MSHSRLNIVIAGDKSVGKSSLIKSFIIDNNDKDNDVSSVEDGNYRTNVTIENRNFTMKITEQSGLDQSHNNQLHGHPQWYHHGFNPDTIHAQVIVYDIANQSSFDFIKKWVFQNRTGAPTILLANQSDLFPKGIDGKECILSYGFCRNYGPQDVLSLCSKYYGKKINGELYTKQNCMSYFEVSAKTKMNVNAALKSIAEQAKTHYDLTSVVRISPRMPPLHRGMVRQPVIRPHTKPRQLQQVQAQQKQIGQFGGRYSGPANPQLIQQWIQQAQAQQIAAQQAGANPALQAQLAANLTTQQISSMQQAAVQSSMHNMSSIQQAAQHRSQSMGQTAQQSQSAQNMQSGPQSTSMYAGSASIPRPSKRHIYENVSSKDESNCVIL